MLRFTRYDDIALFEQDTFPFLQQNEIRNNLLLGLLQSEVNRNPVLMATLKKDEQIQLVLLQTHTKHNIIFSSTDGLTNKKEIIDCLIENVDNITGLCGDKEFVQTLAEKWTRDKGISFSLHMNQRLFKLTKIEKEASGNGIMRKAEEKDLPLVRDWLYQFCVDVNEEIEKEEAQQKAHAVIAKNSLYLWEADGKVVSMANATRPTQTNIMINSVFTPNEERKKGYATNIVSALSQLMLDSGYRTISLYTDLSNPTSNKIYMEIGYKPLEDSIVLKATK